MRPFYSTTSEYGLFTVQHQSATFLQYNIRVRPFHSTTSEYDLFTVRHKSVAFLQCDIRVNTFLQYFIRVRPFYSATSEYDLFTVRHQIAAFLHAVRLQNVGFWTVKHQSAASKTLHHCIIATIAVEDERKICTVNRIYFWCGKLRHICCCSAAVILGLRKPWSTVSMYTSTRRKGKCCKFSKFLVEVA